MDVIATKDLSKRFQSFTAVDEVTFTVSEGDIFGLVGPDGAGKTTLLRMLTTIVEPTSGDAMVLGLHSSKQAESIKERIGYLSQKCGLYPDLTVLENLEFFADIYSISKKDRKNKIQELLEFSDLSSFKGRLAGNLSGGMKQKLGLACALIHQPQILFLDEPTYGVDPVSRRELWRKLYQLVGQKMTIVLATSDMNEAERCGQLGFMYKGKMIARGSPEDIRRLYQGGLFEIKHENPSEIYKILQREFGNHRVRQCGNKILFFVSNVESIRESVDGILGKLEIGRYEMTLVEPALEDVFIAFVTEHSL
jgi:ABC-2 type transport system ATP-binding protein